MQLILKNNIDLKKPLFSKILVVNDRKQLDEQLRDTTSAFLTRLGYSDFEQGKSVEHLRQLFQQEYFYSKLTLTIKPKKSYHMHPTKTFPLAPTWR